MPVIHASTLATGNLEGAAHGATISLILDHSEPGKGPRLHRHPYDETWVVQEGSLTFQLGDTRHNAGPGDIIIAPANVPHKFTNDGPGRSNLVCIHASPMNSSRSAAKLNRSSTGPRSGRPIGVLGTAARIIAGIVCILLGLLPNSHGIQLRASLWAGRVAAQAAQPAR